MRLSQITYALIAAGVGAGLATGYTHLDSMAIGAAQAATQPAALTAPVVAANLPDFTALVDRAGASVVNISTFHAKGKGAPDAEDHHGHQAGGNDHRAVP